MRQAFKSKVVSGFAQTSGLALIGGAFAVVIGCPYSDQIREIGFWIGAALVTGLTLYSASQIITHFKAIFTTMLSQGYRLANIPSIAITAAISFWRRVWPPQTIQAQNLRLPPDIFCANKMLK